MTSRAENSSLLSQKVPTLGVPLGQALASGQQATVAVASMNRSLRRFMSIAVPFTFLEVSFNAWHQWNYLNQGFSMVAMALLLLGQLGMFVSSWFGSGDRGWFGYYALLNMLLIVLWPLPFLAPAEFPKGGQPWLWWCTGMAVLCSVLYAGPVVSFCYTLLLAGGFVIIRLSASGGGVDVIRAVEDAAYIVLLGAILGGLYYMVLFAARRADIASTLAIRQLTKRTNVDAFERERQLVDALVHDRVLNALLVAASADTATQRRRAAVLAQQAIDDLQNAASERGAPETLTTQALFRALRKAAGRIDPKIQVEVQSSSRLPLSQEVAAALTEATLQAIDNSQRHSAASELKILMSANQSEMFIEITDNGKGFRVGRVPKNRLGISNSILARMAHVSGSAEISSEPGSGTRVILRWAT